MLRLRLAALTLASGLLVSMSGCLSICNTEPCFPRVRSFFASRSAAYGAVPECECGHVAGAPEFPGMMVPGPTFNVPPPNAIPITTVPTTQPGSYRAPQAMPTPYSPTLIK